MFRLLQTSQCQAVQEIKVRYTIRIAVYRNFIVQSNEGLSAKAETCSCQYINSV